MKIIQPARYQWLSPLLVLMSGILGLMNNDVEKVFRIGWSILIFFSIILLVIGILNHRKYYQQQAEELNKKNETTNSESTTH